MKNIYGLTRDRSTMGESACGCLSLAIINVAVAFGSTTTRATTTSVLSSAGERTLPWSLVIVVDIVSRRIRPAESRVGNLSSKKGKQEERSTILRPERTREFAGCIHRCAASPDN